MSNYNNAFVEVNVILNFLNQEEYKKIPESLIIAMRKNQNKNYKFNFDVNKSINEQITLPETKAILFNLFRDYLSTDIQREKIIKMQKEERYKLDKIKKDKYNSNIFENENKFKKSSNQELIVINNKENVFRKILNFIKNIFK